MYRIVVVRPSLSSFVVTILALSGASQNDEQLFPARPYCKEAHLYLGERDARPASPASKYSLYNTKGGAAMRRGRKWLLGRTFFEFKHEFRRDFFTGVARDFF